MSTTAFGYHEQEMQDFFQFLLEEGFFINERQKDERIEELRTSSQQEAWFSNGVVEFKILHDAWLEGYTFHNFRRLTHPTLNRVENAFPSALQFN